MILNNDYGPECFKRNSLIVARFKICMQHAIATKLGTELMLDIMIEKLKIENCPILIP